MDTEQIQKELASNIGKLLRDNFGRGPESIFVTIQPPIITIYLKKFVTPAERILFNENQEGVVQTSRDILMDNLIPEIRSYMKFITGLEVEEFYYDWNFHNYSGMIVAYANNQDSLVELANQDYFGKNALHEEINYIGLQAQKIPEETISYPLNERTVVVVRTGILVSIERELIRMGHQEVLRIAKRRVEKRLLHNNMRFESIFDKKINDSFVSWDFSRDKSVITFILDPNQRGSNGLDK